MFGNFNRNLDNKNRVIIPSKLRLQFGAVCFMTHDLDNVVSIRNEANFGEWSQKLLGLNDFSKDARQLKRAMLGRTHKIEIDKQGRIKLESNLMKTLSLTKEVVFVGVGNKVEIHSKENFDKMQQDFEKSSSLDELADKLLKSGAEL